MYQITLKAARVNSGLSLIEASAKLGINKDTLSKYEHNSTNISISLLKKMQVLYQVSGDILFLGDVLDHYKKFK